MKILNRKEFVDEMNEIMHHHGKDCSDEDHILWEAEKYLIPPYKCQWFVLVAPIDTHSSKTYWDWCDSTLRNSAHCFSSDDREHEEWWGFVEEQDAVIWALKWAA